MQKRRDKNAWKLLAPGCGLLASDAAFLKTPAWEASFAPDVTKVFDTPKKCKAHLDSNRGAFLGLQNKCWCFDLQVS